MSFFAFEGIDGSGKSTQIELLEKELLAQGHSVLRIREPGGTQLSEEVRDIILRPRKGGLDSKAELFLYSASRAQLLAQVVAPALKEGKIILSDRSPWSTLAYQGYGRGLDLKEIETLLKMTCGELFPSKTFVIDISVKESRLRLAQGRESLDRIEQENDSFFHLVRDGYHKISQKNSSVELLDGTQSIEALQSHIITTVSNILKETV